MKKSFMTRVLAVSLSAAMAFSMSSASNLMTASAASTVQLKTTFKTLKVKQTYKMTLKNNTLNWKITKVTTSDKTICTVYNKTASSVMLKGKSVGRAKIRIKVKTANKKRKYPKNIKWMTCTAKVVAATPSDSGETTAFSATANANSTKEVRVTFSKEVDGVEPANFTVSDGITVSTAELSADKKSALLEIAGAEYGKTYDLTVTGVKVAGAVQEDLKLSFTTPAAEEKYPMTLKAEKPILKADGHDQTLVTFTISDAQGNPITDKGIEVAFQTSLGKFAEQRVTVQDGKATVMFNSVALKETATAAITATVVESTDNKELMGLTTASSITMNPKGDDTSVGAVITSATAGTADRVIAYFNQKVSAADFKTKTGKIDTTKFDCVITSGLDNGFYELNNSTTHRIKGILDVESEENALQLLVDEPMIDNSNVKVHFENKSSADSTVKASNDVYFKLADAHQPSMLRVENEGLRKLTVTFSEAVLPNSLSNYKDTGVDPFAADNLNNYLIDGQTMEYWGVEKIETLDEEQADSSDGNLYRESTKNDEINTPEDGKGWIKVGSYKDGKDTRNEVTIMVGTNRYLPAGEHTLTVSNVGDWAAKTDRERNIINSESYNFTVVANEDAPKFEVTEQSPEQWLLTFNCSVKPAVDGDTIRTPRSAEGPINDRVDDQNNNLVGKQSVIRLQRLDGTTWKNIDDATDGTDKNPIRVSQVYDDDGIATDQYLVEVCRDWTEVYNTAGTRNNYMHYNFRLHVDADKLVNTANGKKNAAIDMDLNGNIMKTADVVSPTIGEIEQAKDKNGNLIDSWNVKLSEPVKMSKAANKEGLTPSQEQAANVANSNNMGVPVPLAQFIKVGSQETVPGIIASEVFIDAADTTINVEPASPLSNGEWQLVLSSISDDYGCTTSTSAQTITVNHETTASNFRVVWAAVSDDENYNVTNLRTIGGNEKGRYIFVKFSHPVTMTGNSVNAGVNANYVLDGNTLPTGTQIRAHIKGYDDHMTTVDSVTIILPQQSYNYGDGRYYLVSKENTILNISKAITSLTGATLSNGGALTLPFQYGATNEFNNLSRQGDAVWGNAPQEQYNPSAANSNQGIKELKDYYQALKSALANDQYRKVVLSGNLPSVIDLDAISTTEISSAFGRGRTLTISRAVDLDLNGKTIKGNVVVDTTDIVKSITIENGTITGSVNNGDASASLTIKAGNVKDFITSNLTVIPGNGKGYAVSINDVFKDSFINEVGSNIAGDVHITDSNDGARFVNRGTVVGKFVIDSTSDVTMSGTYTANNTMVLNQTGKLIIGKGKNDVTLNGVTIRATVAGSRIQINDNATLNGVNIIAAAKNVRITVSPAQVNDITFLKDNNGEFVQVTDKDVVVKSTDAGYVDALEDKKVAVGGLQAELEKVAANVAGGQGTVENNAIVVTCSAVSPVALDITEIQSGLQKTVNEQYEGAPVYSVSVSYYHPKNDSTERVTTVEGHDVIRPKKDAKAGDATITVTLKANNVTVTKTIIIRVQA